MPVIRLANALAIAFTSRKEEKAMEQEINYNKNASGVSTVSTQVQKPRLTIGGVADKVFVWRRLDQVAYARHVPLR